MESFNPVQPGLGESVPQTAVRYEYSADFPGILEHLGASLAISTYQAGQLVLVGVAGGKLEFSFHSFRQPMGIAVSPDCIAVGSHRELHLLRGSHDIARRIAPAGTYDSAWIARSSIITGAIQSHEMAWGAEGLYYINTLFSCICTIDDRHSFNPVWKPPFISVLEPNDRCHLNGLAMKDGKPAFVTCHGQSDEPGGWRPNKSQGGAVLAVESGETVATGLAMPHSPRWAHQRLWVLHSGAGQLSQIELGTGKVQPVADFPGYVRGLDFAGQFAFVGLSKIREKSVFGNMPIERDRANLRCGVGVFDLVSGKTVASLQFHSGVDEIFSVAVIPNSRRPFLVAQNDTQGAEKEIWILPETVRAAGQSQPEARMTPEVDSSSLAQQQAVHAEQLHSQGRLQEALLAFRRSLELDSNQPTTLCNLGNLWQDLEDQHQALECYQAALKLDPNLIPALQNLGYLYNAHCRPEEAASVYQRLVELQPTPLNRILDAGILPVIYKSHKDLEYWRNRMTSRLDALVAQQAKIDTSNMLVPTSFFLAYQGKNNVDVMRQLGKIYHGPQLVQPATTRLEPRSDGRLRVGFISAYFRDHTIGRLNLGRIQRLDRSRFEVTVLATSNRNDPVTAQFRNAADRYMNLERHVQRARERIVDQDLDVLIFADIGMDALTSTLSWSRMAPIQCATWGHPETTGSPHMDFFLSSKLLEQENADAHYTEKLIRFNRLATYFERPTTDGGQVLSRAQRRERSEGFGLTRTANHFVCPQTLYKLHPDFDKVLHGILSTDHQAQIVLIEGREVTWTSRLKQRFAESLGGMHDRIAWLKPLPRPDYLRLLAASDVVLDPLHFGGGHSSYEALGMAAPIVTLPGEFLRSRITLALYRLLGIEDGIVSNATEYVKSAINLATNESARQSFSQRIIDNSSKIFENEEEVSEFGEWLWSLTRSIES